MSFLDEIRSNKHRLKPTITNITHSDGSQEQILPLSHEATASSTNTNCNKKQTIQIPSKAYGFVVDTKPDHKPACILPDFLYLGSQDSVLLENIRHLRITDVLSVGIKTPDFDISAINDSGLAVRCHFVPCLDLPETHLHPIIDQTNAIISRVRNEDGCVLVHCNAGVSRSATVCIAYLMQEMKMSFDAAFDYVKSARKCIQPNCGFLLQLKELSTTNEE